MRTNSRIVEMAALAMLCACTGLPMRSVQPATDQGYQKMQQGDAGGAIALYTQGINADPADWQAYSLRGQAYMKLGRHDLALADFIRWTQLAPNAEQPWAWAGDANNLLGRYADAVRCYDKALAVKERFQTRGSRGAALYHLGRYEEAVADARKAQAELPAGPSADRDIDTMVEASSLSLSEKYDEAIAAYGRYRAEHPGGPWAEHLFYEGMTYARSGKLEQARADADRLVEAWPNFQPRYAGEHAIEIFDLARRKADMAAAIETSKKLEAAGNLPGAFSALTSAWPAQSPGTPEANEAMARMKALYPKLKDKPDLPENARRFAVQAKMFMKDAKEPGSDGYHKALGAYNTLLSIAPWYPPAYFNAALLRAELKDYAWAVKDMKTYLELVPDAPDARAAQDKIYEWQAR